MWPPRLLTACSALPPEGATAPVARQSRFHGPCWNGEVPSCALSLRERAGGEGSAAPRPTRDGFTVTLTLRSRRNGFTLIELLVALSVMAMLAILSWRGLEGMARAQTQTSQRADEVLTLQAGLGQWKADLDALARAPGINSLDWDGRVLRLTRRSTTGNDGLTVVAWTRRADGDGVWLRWQSPAVLNIGNWTDAWDRAAVWAQTASDEDRQFEVRVTPLLEWQIFYFRGNAWSNPLSSDGVSNVTPPPATPRGSAGTTVPDGIRLVLNLPPGQAINGRLSIDWVRPTLGGDR